MMKEFLQRLIRAESTCSCGELAAAEVIADHLGKSDIESQIDIWDSSRANIFARIESDNKGPALLFVCHLDVVPAGENHWQYPPFEAVEENGRIHGRGSADMKAGIAAAVTAIREIVDAETKLAGDIIFLAAAGEETDSCGVKRFVENHRGKLPELAGIVIPEPTDFEVVTAHRGALWLKVSTKGRAAHGSTPQLGTNAITSMRKFLNELDNYDIPFAPHETLGRCSISVNTIEAGKSVNTVPDQCDVQIDIRTLPSQNHQDIINDLENIGANLKQTHPEFDAQVSLIRDVGALETDTDCDFVRDFCSAVGTDKTRAVGFCTDGPFLAPLQLPVVIFGPGKPKLCHKPNEYIDIADVEKAVEHYKKIIANFCI